MNLPTIQTFDQRIKLANSLVKDLASEELQIFQKELQAKIEYISKIKKISQAKKDVEELENHLTDLFSLIAFVEAKTIKPFGKKRMPRRIAKNRHYFKKIQTPEELKEEMADMRKDGLKINPKNIGKKLNKKPQVKIKKTNYKLYNLNIVDFGKKIKQNSVDLILTDPVSINKGVKIYKELSVFGQKVLKPGASLITFVDKVNLPETINNLSISLDYHWCLSLVQSGPNIIKQNAFSSYEILLLFTKGEYKGNKFYDLIRTDVSPKKRQIIDRFQQPPGAMKSIIRKIFLPKNSVVCDPFMGCGSVAIAALSEEHLFLGSDSALSHVDYVSCFLSENSLIN